jgi:hypothetical protein
MPLLFLSTGTCGWPAPSCAVVNAPRGHALTADGQSDGEGLEEPRRKGRRGRPLKGIQRAAIYPGPRMRPPKGPGWELRDGNLLVHAAHQFDSIRGRALDQCIPRDVSVARCSDRHYGRAYGAERQLPALHTSPSEMGHKETYAVQQTAPTVALDLARSPASPAGIGCR